MNAALARINDFAEGWVGKIDAIRTEHGGGSASVRIRSVTNSLYESNKDILIGSQLYQQLAPLTVGSKVVFSGKFISTATPGKFEWSISERGSLEEPEYHLEFTSIVPFGQPEPAYAHVQATQPTVETKASISAKTRQRVKFKLSLKQNWSRVQENNDPDSYMIFIIYKEPPTPEDVRTDTTEVVNKVIDALAAKGLNPQKNQIDVICAGEMMISDPATGRTIARIFGNTAFAADVGRIDTQIKVENVDVTDIPDLADHTNDVLN